MDKRTDGWMDWSLELESEVKMESGEMKANRRQF